MSRSGIVRTGVHVTAAPSGCDGCGHPFTLHSNGRTPCRAAGCSAGSAATCPACNGTTSSLVTREQCAECGGRGTLPAPCQGFTARGHAREVPELLAS